MTSSTRKRPRRRLGIVLTVLLLVTMFMGVGPGLRLINPDPTRPGSAFSVFGLPTVYAWGLLWYVVQLAVILIACFTLWRTDGEDHAPER
ncbi:MAG TPA: hypothetical protein VMY39_09965 [Planctomycetota bacterium]|nr:hypothetical protein [Planctomycetota bacterium]HUW55267.1 hypothetical protein [Planctomycetota bacterium]